MKPYLGSTRLDCAPSYIYSNYYRNFDSNFDDDWSTTPAHRLTTAIQNLPAGGTKCPIPFRMPVTVQ